MNTIDLEEVKNAVANKHGYESFNLALPSSCLRIQNLIIEEVATEYAKQCCDEQIRNCSESYIDNIVIEDADVFSAILSTPNVVKQ